MSVRHELKTPEQIIRAQAETIRQKDAVIDTLKADQIAHVIVGLFCGAGLVILARWQGDPLIRLLDDALTFVGWTAS